MKRLIILAVLAATLSGCASYGELTAQCNSGNAQACTDKANRDAMFSGMNAELDREAATGTGFYQQAPKVNAPIHTSCTPNIFGGMDCNTY